MKVGERDLILAEYATNAVEIQVDGEGNGGLHTFAEAARTLSWVENVTIDHNVARIMVSDIQAGKQNLLQIVTQSGLPIVRVEWVRPSLEEVFLELSE